MLSFYKNNFTIKSLTSNSCETYEAIVEKNVFVTTFIFRIDVDLFLDVLDTA